MNNPAISIDRQSKSFAVFEGATVIRPFEKYSDESEAERIARAFVAERTDKVPEMIYPCIRKMAITRRK